MPLIKSKPKPKLKPKPKSKMNYKEIQIEILIELYNLQLTGAENELFYGRTAASQNYLREGVQSLSGALYSPATFRALAKMDLIENRVIYQGSKIRLTANGLFVAKHLNKLRNSKFTKVHVWKTNDQGWAVDVCDENGVQDLDSISFHDSKGEATGLARHIAKENDLAFFLLGSAKDLGLKSGNKVYLNPQN